ncbi:Uncharacterised protein [uncultured archaeon]|nr:Uncharacterised protein [uncultured archaeon]
MENGRITQRTIKSQETAILVDGRAVQDPEAKANLMNKLMSTAGELTVTTAGGKSAVYALDENGKARVVSSQMTESDAKLLYGGLRNETRLDKGVGAAAAAQEINSARDAIGQSVQIIKNDILQQQAQQMKVQLAGTKEDKMADSYSTAQSLIVAANTAKQDGDEKKAKEYATQAETYLKDYNKQVKDYARELLAIAPTAIADDSRPLTGMLLTELDRQKDTLDTKTYTSLKKGLTEVQKDSEAGKGNLKTAEAVIVAADLLGKNAAAGTQADIGRERDRLEIYTSVIRGEAEPTAVSALAGRVAVAQTEQLLKATSDLVGTTKQQIDAQNKEIVKQYADKEITRDDRDKKLEANERLYKTLDEYDAHLSGVKKLENETKYQELREKQAKLYEGVQEGKVDMTAFVVGVEKTKRDMEKLEANISTGSAAVKDYYEKGYITSTPQYDMGVAKGAVDHAKLVQTEAGDAVQKELKEVKMVEAATQDMDRTTKMAQKAQFVAAYLDPKKELPKVAIRPDSPAWNQNMVGVMAYQTFEDTLKGRRLGEEEAKRIEEKVLPVLGLQQVAREEQQKADALAAKAGGRKRT